MVSTTGSQCLFNLWIIQHVNQPHFHNLLNRKTQSCKIMQIQLPGSIGLMNNSQHNQAKLKYYQIKDSHSLPEFNLPLIGAFTWLTPPGPYRATTCREREWTFHHIHTFLTTQGHEGPPRMREQLNPGATSETTRNCKTIHTIHALIHSNKINMKGWLWWLNDIRGPCGSKSSWHLSYGWGKTPKKPHPGNLSRPEIEPRLACYRLLHRGGRFRIAYRVEKW